MLILTLYPSELCKAVRLNAHWLMAISVEQLACLQQVLLICSFLQGESDFGLKRRNAINETGPKSCSRLGQCKGAKNWYRSLGNEEETAYYSTNIGTPAHPVLCTNRGRDRFLLHLILIFNDFWFNPSQTMEDIFRVNLQPINLLVELLTNNGKSNFPVILLRRYYYSRILHKHAKDKWFNSAKFYVTST